MEVGNLQVLNLHYVPNGLRAFRTTPRSLDLEARIHGYLLEGVAEGSGDGLCARLRAVSRNLQALTISRVYSLDRYCFNLENDDQHSWPYLEKLWIDSALFSLSGK